MMRWDPLPRDECPVHHLVKVVLRVGTCLSPNPEVQSHTDYSQPCFLVLLKSASFLPPLCPGDCHPFGFLPLLGGDPIADLSHPSPWGAPMLSNLSASFLTRAHTWAGPGLRLMFWMFVGRGRKEQGIPQGRAPGLERKRSTSSLGHRTPGFTTHHFTSWWGTGAGHNLSSSFSFLSGRRATAHSSQTL